MTFAPFLLLYVAYLWFVWLRNGLRREFRVAAIAVTAILLLTIWLYWHDTTLPARQLFPFLYDILLGGLLLSLTGRPRQWKLSTLILLLCLALLGSFSTLQRLARSADLWSLLSKYPALPILAMLKTAALANLIYVGRRRKDLLEAPPKPVAQIFD